MNDPDWLPPARPPGQMMNEACGSSLPLSLKVCRPIRFACWQLNACTAAARDLLQATCFLSCCSEPAFLDDKTLSLG